MTLKNTMDPSISTKSMISSVMVVWFVVKTVMKSSTNTIGNSKLYLRRCLKHLVL